MAARQTRTVLYAAAIFPPPAHHVRQPPARPQRAAGERRFRQVLYGFHSAFVGLLLLLLLIAITVAFVRCRTPWS